MTAVEIPSRVITFLIVLAARWIGMFAESPSAANPPMTRKKRISLIAMGGVGLLFVALMSRIWWFMTFVPPITNADVPSPNGLDTLLRVGSTLKNRPRPFVYQASQDDAVIDAVRQSLSQEWGRLVNRSGRNEDERNDDLQNVGELFRFLCAIAAAKRESGNVDQSLDVALAGIRVASRFRIGATLTQAGVADARLEMCSDELRLVWHVLDLQQSRRLVAELEAIEIAREPMEAVFARTWIWESNTGNWQPRFQYGMPMAGAGLIPTGFDLPHFVGDRRRFETRQRLKLVHLALNAFRLEQGRLPDRLGELTPRLLSSVPTDPFSGKPLMYRRTSSDEFLLYSVGPNGTDDGGWIVFEFRDLLTRGDFFLDPPDAVPET